MAHTSAGAVGGTPVKLGDSASLDAFGRLRVSAPETLFESSYEYDLQPTWFQQITSASGTVTHDSDLRSAILTATVDSGSSAAVQTYNYFPYEKGKSQKVVWTFVLGTGVASVVKEVGYYDSANGIFLQQDGTNGLKLVLRSSVSGSPDDTEVAQASWNVDPMDGTGPSGIVLDVTKQQIFAVDAQWLGAGRVRCGFNVDGVTYVVHEFRNANRNSSAPYMQTFNLPLRASISATGVTAGATFQLICCEVESEGGVSSPNGYVFSAINSANVTTSTAETYVLSIRPKGTFNSLVNRTFVIPLDVSVIAESQSVAVSVYHGATLTGGSWASADTASVIEVGTGQTISTPGKRIQSFFVGASNQVKGSLSGSVNSTYPVALDADATNPLALTITATTLSGAGTARAAFNWKEVR